MINTIKSKGELTGIFDKIIEQALELLEIPCEAFLRTSAPHGFYKQMNTRRSTVNLTLMNQTQNLNPQILKLNVLIQSPLSSRCLRTFLVERGAEGLHLYLTDMLQFEELVRSMTNGAGGIRKESNHRYVGSQVIKLYKKYISIDAKFIVRNNDISKEYS